VQYVIFVAPLLCLVDVPEALRWGWVSGLFIGVVYWTFRVAAAHPTSLIDSNFPLHARIIGLAAWAILLHFVWRHRPSQVSTLEPQSGAVLQ
jgi:hypothetical protein